MNIEEARKVLWLKNYPRPLGELFDEGYLNQSKLKWAVEKAKDPQLREAAKIFLEILSKPSQGKQKKEVSPFKSEAKHFNVGINLENARATLWPFPPRKGQPMGVLLDSKQISLRDLGFAIENAWDEKVREAAIALSLKKLDQRINEPAPPVGFVRIVSGGRTYSEQMETRLTLLEGLVFGIAITIAFYILWGTVQNLLRPHPNARPIAELLSSPILTIAALVLIGLAAVGAWLFVSIPEQIVKRLDKQIEEYQRGQEGEDRTVQLIAQVLDGNWCIFRNLSLPGRNKGDLDLVLVGPPGVWVFEVKNYRGQYRNVGDKWEYKKGKTWKNAATNPSAQAQKNAGRLASFLRADRLNMFVNPAVIWANPESSLFIENPLVAIWQYDHMSDELGNIWQVEKLSKTEREKIIGKLEKLCAEQRKKDAGDDDKSKF